MLVKLVYARHQYSKRELTYATPCIKLSFVPALLFFVNNPSPKASENCGQRNIAITPGTTIPISITFCYSFFFLFANQCSLNYLGQSDFLVECILACLFFITSTCTYWTSLIQLYWDKS